jgi:hypothetical protein
VHPSHTEVAPFSSRGDDRGFFTIGIAEAVAAYRSSFLM